VKVTSIYLYVIDFEQSSVLSMHICMSIKHKLPKKKEEYDFLIGAIKKSVCKCWSFHISLQFIINTKES
jgi:hypothetical protein